MRRNWRGLAFICCFDHWLTDENPRSVSSGGYKSTCSGNLITCHCRANKNSVLLDLLKFIDSAYFIVLMFSS